jgi:chaperonin GroEL
MSIYKNDETRKHVLEGAEILYDAVKTTLGPRGRNVLIKDKFGGFTITHDGVTVAKAVQLKDEPNSIGVEIIKEASRKMNEIGDGTTTVTVLTYHLMLEADKLIKKGYDPMLIKRQLEAEVPKLIEAIEAKSVKIEKNFEAVKQVATVSVGNEKLGEQIAELMTEVGYDGAISVEQTQSPDTTFKPVEGFSFDRGYMSPYFITSQGSREAVLKNPAVILVNGVISDLEEYKNVLDVLFSENIKNVIIVAENIEAEALGTLILNKVKNVLNVVTVKTPGYGDKLDWLKDIAAVTGAKVIDPNVGDWQNNLGLNTLGAADKIIVGFDETIIIGGKGDVAQHVEKLKKRFRKIKLDEREPLEQRIARLNGSVGMIKVGGQTETEAEEKKYRIDDAVAAVKAAMKGGIVAGGGTTLRDISLPYFFDEAKGDDLPELTEDRVKGMLGVALNAPYTILLENSGLDPAMKTGDKGVNVLTGEVVDMFKVGIVDPTDVTKEAVRNAITTACLAITVGGSIVEQQLTQEQMTNLMSNMQ